MTTGNPRVEPESGSESFECRRSKSINTETSHCRRDDVITKEDNEVMWRRTDKWHGEPTSSEVAVETYHSHFTYIMSQLFHISSNRLSAALKCQGLPFLRVLALESIFL